MKKDAIEKSDKDKSIRCCRQPNLIALRLTTSAVTKSEQVPCDLGSKLLHLTVAMSEPNESVNATC